MHLIRSASKLYLTVFAICCAVPQLLEAGKMSVGVGEVEVTPALKESLPGNKINPMNRVSQAMENQLIDRLHNTRKFKVVARGDLEKVLEEQDLQKAFTTEGAAQAFKIAGCKYAVVTTVDNFQDIVEKLKGAGGQVLASKRRIRLSAVAKIYDTTSGELKESANFQLTNKEGREHELGISSDGSDSDKLLMVMARTMADRIANRVLDVAFPAKVIAKTGEFVMINRGDGTSISKGQTWQVFHPGEEVIDPDTGEVLGRGETPIGKVTVVEVTPKFSRARIIEDFGIAKLNILRKITQSEK